jgi:hypothetical protein
MDFRLIPLGWMKGVFGFGGTPSSRLEMNPIGCSRPKGLAPVGEFNIAR